MITDRRLYGEFSPIESLRGELCDLLVIFDYEPPMSVMGQIAWVEASSQPPDCELIEFAPIVGVLTTADVIREQTRDRITALTTPDGIGIWVKLLSSSS